jgi:hypothetical protein
MAMIMILVSFAPLLLISGIIGHRFEMVDDQGVQIAYADARKPEQAQYSDADWFKKAFTRDFSSATSSRNFGGSLTTSFP